MTTADLARFILMAALVGAYFALWATGATGAGRWRAGGACGRQGGMLGAMGSVCGLATGGCTVMGCGAPVIPVVGLAFVGLSSATLTLFAQVSTYATLAVVAGLLGRRALPRVARRRPAPSLLPSPPPGARADSLSALGRGPG